MEQPVLVRAYTNRRAPAGPSRVTNAAVLPPISAYAFADIVRAADSKEFQSAIDEIAAICAKNRLSLAEEHTAHRPPVGEITEASSRNVGPQLRKPGMRRALTSVPEGSSGSSEGSRRSKRRNIFGFRSKEETTTVAQPRVIRIGSMGRTISVQGTTAVADESSNGDVMATSPHPIVAPVSSSQSPSTALTSLQRILGINVEVPD